MSGLLTKYHDAYCAIVCKSIKNFSVENCTIDISYTIVLRVKIEDPEEAEFIKKRFSYRVNEVEEKMFPDYDPDDPDSEENQSKADKEHKKAYNAKTKLLRFVIRKDGTLDVNPNKLADEVAQCPFDYIPALLRFELTSITDVKKNTIHRFNFTMHKDPLGNVQLSFKRDCDKLAEYNIDVDSCVVYPVKENKGATSGIEYWPIVIYHFSLYRDPTYLIQSTLVQLLLLNFLIIAVFCMDTTDYSGKLSYISTLFLGLVAFIPSIRSGLPPLPSLTLLEKQVYVTVGLLFLSLFTSVYLRLADMQGYTDDYFDSSNSTNYNTLVSSVTFSIACLFTFASFLYWLVRYIQFKYTIHVDPEDEAERKQDSGEFAPDDWYPAEHWGHVTPEGTLRRRGHVVFKGYDYHKKYDVTDTKGDGYYRF